MLRAAVQMEVLDLMRRRAAGDDTDEYKLTLAIDGGGMRGIVSGAMLIALRDSGLSSLFDEYVGVSAAAINLAYWAAGWSWDALSMYYDYLPNHFFRRGVQRLHRPMLKMEYLDSLFTQDFPISSSDIAKLCRPVITFSTNVDTQEIETIDLAAADTEVIAALKASAWLPVAAGLPYRSERGRYIDGGILVAHPLYTAIARGATHVLALSPGPDVGDSASSRRVRPVMASLLNTWSKGLGDKYIASRQIWDADRERMRGTGGEVDINSAKILSITTSAEDHNVTRLTRDTGELLRGARAGYARVCRLSGEQPLTFTYSVQSVGERPHA